MPEIAAAQVLVLLCQGDLAGAAQLAQAYALPLARRGCSWLMGTRRGAGGAGAAAWAGGSQGWQDETAQRDRPAGARSPGVRRKDRAVQLLGEALALAEPGGFIRLFVDEGESMRLLILDFDCGLKNNRAARISP